MSATGRILGHVGIHRDSIKYRNTWDGIIKPNETFLDLLLTSATSITYIVPSDGLIQPGRRLFINVRATSGTLTLVHTGISGDVKTAISCNNTSSNRDVAAGYVVEVMQLPNGMWIETYYRQLL